MICMSYSHDLVYICSSNHFLSFDDGVMQMNVRDLMVVEHIMRDYPPGGANDKHDPNKPPH